MKVVCISHSNIALRQQKFWQVFSKYAEVLVISPDKWNNHSAKSVKDDNYELFACHTYNSGSMVGYHFSPEAYLKIQEFKPDVIYYQGEVYTNQAIMSQQWASLLECKYVQFIWENIRYPTARDEHFLKLCDLIICGNSKAKELHGGNIVLPQVGIDCLEFKPMEDKKYDVLFLGRPDPAKGIEYIKQAYPETLFIHDAPYDQVPGILGSTKIFVTYPHDTPFWKEQWMSYAVAEAMASGAVVVTSDSEAVVEYLKNSPARIVPQYSPDVLRKQIIYFLEHNKERNQLAEDSITFAQQFDNSIIARKLIKVFEVLFL